MAADLLRFLQSLVEGSQKQDEQITLLGHSMGGKVAMTLALHPDTPKSLLKNLIVEDVSPIKGRLSNEFTGYARAMRRIMDMNLKDRKEADEVLKEIEPVYISILLPYYHRDLSRTKLFASRISQFGNSS
jgi:pimeloyl-ACP methyl ester carboxylesterase